MATILDMVNEGIDMATIIRHDIFNECIDMVTFISHGKRGH